MYTYIFMYIKLFMQCPWQRSFKLTICKAAGMQSTGKVLFTYLEAHNYAR